MTFPLTHVEGVAVTVLGAARSGVAVARMLHDKQANVFVSDSAASSLLERSIEELEREGIAFETGKHSDRAHACDLMVLSPGVPSDIPLLARHFLELYGERFGRPGLSLSREALAALMTHPFPGNVRELENAIQAAIALAPEETIAVDDLRLEVESRQDPSSGGLISLSEVERRHIENVLRAVDGNRQEAARILGIDRTTLYRKLQRFASHDAESIN